ncbi:YdbL family protein [Aquisalimonas lutea]|uniref:YdbL family protein n=1 Tax=Aquisalimonas lutea TaxID=1327750 RepID=UPI0025B347D4|nr:YdbL family protein [Aquisalimonas lutea]MDN3519168.1 YdbL family protein [Aquisalimonas lutea]
MPDSATHRLLGALLAVLVLTLAACVTINVYFPAVAAERAADRIIDDVWRQQPPPEPEEEPDEPQSRNSRADRPVLVAVLDRLITPAAAASPDLDISSPAIRRLTAAMEERHERLRPYYDSGAVGLTNDGRIAIRDQNAIPLQERNRVRQLVADENDDRLALYRQIAVANNHPEWEEDIRATFADRWIARAPSGWYYQDDAGNWKRK